MAIASFRTQYEHLLQIPSFLGLNQSGDGVDISPRYCTDCTGIDFSEGSIKPYHDSSAVSPALPFPIVTLAMLHRRYYADTAHQDLMVASAGGKLYARVLDGEWQEVGSGYASDAWDTIAYEVNRSETAPTDVLLLTNAQDGMICLFGDDLHVEAVTTPKKFGVITRHAERIWGAAIPGDPDMLVYSAPYDPLDWTANIDLPQDGAGDVLQPSWDGDGFIALRTFGEFLVAFKRRSVWRVSGVGPGEYAFTQVFGGGTVAENTVCVDRDRVLMLGRTGIQRFDGSVVAPHDIDRARDFFEDMDQKSITLSCAAMYNNNYYLAVPSLGESVSPDKLLIIDRPHNTWSVVEGVSIRSFCPTETALYFTSGDDPYCVYEWASSDLCVPVRWVSPWIEMAKHVYKSGFILRLTPLCADPLDIILGIQTEKRLKTKTVRFNGERQKSVAIGHTGKRFRISIECNATLPWEISGGLMVEMELDPE